METTANRLASYKAEAQRYNTWRKRWKRLLLTRYSIRLARLEDSYLERQFANILLSLSHPWVVKMSNLDDCINRLASTVTDEILVECFVSDVRKAERQKRN